VYSCILLPPITKVLVVKESIFATKCMVLFSMFTSWKYHVPCAFPFDHHERIRLKVGFTGETATESSWGEGIARASQEYAAME
jgi:hypothetical protein